MAYDHDASVLDDVRTDLKVPRPFAVVFHNDDATTFDFVCSVLMAFFGKTREEALRTALGIHLSGRGVVGVYPRQIAEAKQMLVLEAARAEGHDAFTVTIEEA
jgi:ATP-dependent Clp protease adaptor protein ClpS